MQQPRQQQDTGPPTLAFLAACSARAYLTHSSTPLRNSTLSLCRAWGAGPALLAEWMAKLALGVGKPKEGRGVTISTIHGAKGLEWDAVFVMRFNDRVLPSEFRGQVC